MIRPLPVRESVERRHHGRLLSHILVLWRRAIKAVREVELIWGAFAAHRNTTSQSLLAGQTLDTGREQVGKKGGGKMRAALAEFMELVAEGKVEIYNEFSLQHELGFHLRGRLPGRQVQFERNVGSFFVQASHFVKKEIDISIDPLRKYAALELKFPTNGQYPEQMFSFCKDIAFLEQLKEAGFSSGFFLALAKDRLFFEGGTEGIYGYFRGGRELTGTIVKPTGARDRSVTIRGRYFVQWLPLANGMRYAVVEV